MRHVLAFACLSLSSAAFAADASPPVNDAPAPATMAERRAQPAKPVDLSVEVHLTLGELQAVVDAAIAQARAAEATKRAEGATKKLQDEIEASQAIPPMRTK